MVILSGSELKRFQRSYKFAENVITPDGVSRRLDVYPVGILRDFVISTVSHGLRFWKWRLHLKDILDDAKQGDWHSIKSCFNGHLAELDPWPDQMQRCGSGWTIRRAVKNLDKLIREADW